MSFQELIDNAPSSEDYLAQRNGQSAETPRFIIGTEAELMALPPLAYLDRELCLIAGGYHLIYGASGSGKTFYAVERAMRQVALGRRVLYIATEDQSSLRYYVAAWRQAHPEATGKLTWLKMPEGLDLQDHAQVAALLGTINPYDYDLVTIDTLREAHSGNENDSADTARVNHAIQRIIATGTAVDLVHHTGISGERPRGSTALFSNASVVIRVEHNDDNVRITIEKLRDVPRDPLKFVFVQQNTAMLDAEGQPVIRAVLRPTTQVTRRDAKLSPSQRTILQTLALSIFDGCGAKEVQLTNHTGLSKRTIYDGLSAMKTSGFISQGVKGDPYYITSEGRAQLGPEFTLAADGDGSADPFSAPGRASAGSAGSAGGPSAGSGASAGSASALAPHNDGSAEPFSALASDYCNASAEPFSAPASPSAGNADEVQEKCRCPGANENAVYASADTRRVCTSLHFAHDMHNEPIPADSLALVDWHRVEALLRAGDTELLRNWIVKMWRPADPDAVFAEAATRWPELFEEAHQ